MTAPTVQRCGVTVVNSLDTAPASGGAGTLAITAARDCAWAASSGAAWVVITSSSTGQGDGSVTYRVAANSEPAARRATIDINNTTAAINQEAAECRFTVTPLTSTVPASGGSVAIQVQGHTACEWTATTDANWVRITSGAAGKGNGSVALGVEGNGAAARTAHVAVAGATVTVHQNDGLPSPPSSPPPPPPPSCSYSIQPGGQTMSASGGTGTIDVTAAVATCAWTAASNAAWITITGGASATGNGRVTFDVAANGGASRSGTISVAGHTFTLTQAGQSCSYSISPSSAAMPAPGGTPTVNVSAGASCAWTSASNASWITITSGGSGTGSGAVQLNVAANGGAARSGTVSIAAQTFTVTQAAAPCTITLSPPAIDIPASGGEGTTTVSAGGGCAWTAVPNAAWITIAGPSSGTGGGTVRINAAANGGAARSGTVTIGGQTLTVTQQAADCTFAISPPSQTLPSGGGSGAVNVTTGPACSWTATSNAPDWLSVTSGSPGTGNGAVGFSVAANAGAQRTGTLTVAGQTFTVTQDAPCAFSIAPTSQTMDAAGGSGTVAVTTTGSCSWAAVSHNTDWLTVSAGSSGTGSGQVSFAVATNSGPQRTGTMTIAGVTFTLTQNAQ